MEEKKDYTFKEIAEIARTLVAPKVAYLAKKLEFNVPTNIIYETLSDGTICISDVNYYNWNSPIYGESTCAAPTQDVLHKWLRAIKEIAICIKPYRGNIQAWTYDIYVSDMYIGDYSVISNDNDNVYKTYEDAYDAALYRALEFIRDAKIKTIVAYDLFGDPIYEDDNHLMTIKYNETTRYGYLVMDLREKMNERSDYKFSYNDYLEYKKTHRVFGVITNKTYNQLFQLNKITVGNKTVPNWHWKPFLHIECKPSVYVENIFTY